MSGKYNQQRNTIVTKTITSISPTPYPHNPRHFTSKLTNKSNSKKKKKKKKKNNATLNPPSPKRRRSPHHPRPPHQPHQRLLQRSPPQRNHLGPRETLPLGLDRLVPMERLELQRQSNRDPAQGGQQRLYRILACQRQRGDLLGFLPSRF